MVFPDYYFFAERRLVNHTSDMSHIKTVGNRWSKFAGDTVLSSVIGICNFARSETYVTPNKLMIVCVRREKISVPGQQHIVH